MAFEIGFAHMHSQAWKDKESENIPATYKIRCTLNIVALLDISEYIELIVRMLVICLAW